MSRPPQYDITLDGQRADASLRDLQRADASIVRMAEAQQHALMSGWGTPPTCFTWSNATYSEATTLEFPLRVPPFCRRFRVVAQTASFASFTLQVGALQPVAFPLQTDGTTTDETWVEGSQSILSPNDEGFLQVLATQSPTWQTVTVLFAWAAELAVASSSQWVTSLAFYPILEPAV